MDNKDIARRFLAKIDEGNGIPMEFLADGFTTQVNGDPPADSEGIRQMNAAFYAAFPDMTHGVSNMVAEGDKVAFEVTLRGTHKGEFMGVAPTGKEITVSYIAIYRIEGDQIAEMRAVTDQMGLMQQIRAIPAPE